MTSTLIDLHQRFLTCCKPAPNTMHPERDFARGVHAFLRDRGATLPGKVRDALERMAGLIYASGPADRFPVDLTWAGDPEQLWCCALLVAAL